MINGKSRVISGLERLASGDSLIHHLHARAKLGVTVLFVVLVVSMPVAEPARLIPFFLYIIVVMTLSGTPVKPLLIHVLPALPFALVGGISRLLSSREAVFIIGSLAVTQGMLAFVSILLKTFLTVSAILLLAATTPFYEIIGQMAVLHVPKVLCLTLSLTWRYITVLLSEVSAQFTAYILRSPGRSALRLRDVGIFIGQLFLRSFDRAERVYQAMQCRGFDGLYGGGCVESFRRRDWLFVIILSLVLVLFRFVDLSEWVGRMILWT